MSLKGSTGIDWDALGEVDSAVFEDSPGVLSDFMEVRDDSCESENEEDQVVEPVQKKSRRETSIKPRQSTPLTRSKKGSKPSAPRKEKASTKSPKRNAAFMFRERQKARVAELQVEIDGLELDRQKAQSRLLGLKEEQRRLEEERDMMREFVALALSQAYPPKPRKITSPIKREFPPLGEAY